jgi:hypothetical protein
MLRVQVLELAIQLVVDDCVVLEPAHLAFGRAHLGEPLASLDYLQRFAVGDHRHTVRYGRNPIAQENLPRRDVHMVMLFVMKPRTTGEQEGKRKTGKHEPLASNEPGDAERLAQWKRVQQGGKRWHRRPQSD